MTTATLNGHRATSARVYLPAYGVGWCEVVLDAEVTLDGAATLVLADLTVTGTVVSGGGFRGRSTYRVAFGAGGWGRELPARAYHNDAGVKVSTVLVDAATAAGESFDASTLPAATVRAGSHFARPAGAASRVLHELAAERWYVGEDGVTRLGRRAAAAIDVAYTAEAVDRAAGVVMIAATSIASVVPGVVVEGVEAVDVVHTVSADAGLRTTIHGAGITDTARRLELWRELADALDPRRKFRGVTEYRVVTLDGERLNLQPVLASLGMPDLRRVPSRPGVAGCRADLALGSRVLVAFVNSDPGRPSVVGFEDAEGSGFAPTRLDLVGEDDDVLAASASGRVVRFGDTVMMPSGAAATPTPTVVVANPIGTSSLSRVRA